MHKCGVCEERGSGYDKIVAASILGIIQVSLSFTVNQKKEYNALADDGIWITT